VKEGGAKAAAAYTEEEAATGVAYGGIAKRLRRRWRARARPRHRRRKKRRRRNLGVVSGDIWRNSTCRMARKIND
jgi:hypothetical protein